MTGEVFISGQLGQALYREGGDLFVVEAEREVRPASPADISLFFGYRAEYEVLEAGRLDRGQLEELLAVRSRGHSALSLILSGMDPELDNDTRGEAIAAADELLLDEAARLFVRARLLSRPLPTVADLEGARLLAQFSRSALASELYTEVSGVADALPLLLTVWQEVASEVYASPEELTAVEKALADAAVFADLAAAIAAGDQLLFNNLLVKFGLDADLRRRLPQAPHLFGALRSKLAERDAFARAFVPAEALQAPSSDDWAEESRDTDRKRPKRRGRSGVQRERRMRGREAKEKVDNQISAIEEQIRRRNLDRARNYLDELIRFQTTHSEREQLAMSLCALAKKAMDASAYDLAETMLTHAFGLGLTDAVILSTHAEFLKATGRLDEALAAYEEAVERFPNDVVTHSGRAEVLKEMGRLDEALAAYDGTIERFPANEVARSGRAEVLKEMSRLDEALAAYDDTIKRFADNVVVRSGRAEVLKEMGRLDEALAAYKETAERFPNDVVARNGRAEVLKEMSRLDEALAAYKETAERFPNDVVARSGRAEVLKEMGRLDEALAAYDDTIKRFADNVVARNAKATLLLLMNRTEEARLLLKVDQPASRQDWIGFHALAMSYLKTGETDEAITRLSYGLQHNPWPRSWPYYAMALGIARLRKGQFAEAIEALSTEDVRFNAAQKKKRLVLLGHSLAGLGRREEALNTLKALGEVTNPHIHTVRGDLFRRFSLDQWADYLPTEEEAAALDEKIYEEEIYLELAA